MSKWVKEKFSDDVQKWVEGNYEICGDQMIGEKVIPFDKLQHYLTTKKEPTK